jgi:primosomal protein N''
VAQVVEHLLCQCEVLNSNLSPTKKTKNKKNPKPKQNKTKNQKSHAVYSPILGTMEVLKITDKEMNSCSQTVKSTIAYIKFMRTNKTGKK